MSSHAERGDENARIRPWPVPRRGSFVPLWLPELRKGRTVLSAAGIQVLELRFAPSHIDVEILNGFGVKRSQIGQGFDCCAGHKRIPPLIAFAVYVLEMRKALYRPTRNM